MDFIRIPISPDTKERLIKKGILKEITDQSNPENRTKRLVVTDMGFRTIDGIIEDLSYDPKLDYEIDETVTEALKRLNADPLPYYDEKSIRRALASHRVRGNKAIKDQLCLSLITRSEESRYLQKTPKDQRENREESLNRLRMSESYVRFARWVLGEETGL